METIKIIDFGGQYSQLIARKVREQHVYAEIVPCHQADTELLSDAACKGIILTGGPESVYRETSPKCSAQILNTGIPVLGICYGFQLMSYLAGGRVSPASHASEYGKTVLTVQNNELFRNIPKQSVVWMSHIDQVTSLPQGFTATAHTDSCSIAAFANERKRLYGVQFHPEVTHTEYGM